MREGGEDSWTIRPLAFMENFKSASLFLNLIPRLFLRTLEETKDEPFFSRPLVKETTILGTRLVIPSLPGLLYLF